MNATRMREIAKMNESLYDAYREKIIRDSYLEIIDQIHSAALNGRYKVTVEKLNMFSLKCSTDEIGYIKGRISEKLADNGYEVKITRGGHYFDISW